MCKGEGHGGVEQGHGQHGHGHQGGCQCGRRAERVPVVAEPRWVASSIDFEFPPVPFPSQRIFELAGEEMLRAAVRSHHTRMRASSIGALFDPDDTRFAAAVEKIADYVIEACGGPDRFTSTQGNLCMRTRHFPFTIDEETREVWIEELKQALAEVRFPRAVLEEYWNWMEPFSLRMVNRRTMRSQPRRHPFHTVREFFDAQPLT